MNLTKKTIHGAAHTAAIADILITRFSLFFQVTPLPADYFDITVKTENAGLLQEIITPDKDKLSANEKARQKAIEDYVAFGNDDIEVDADAKVSFNDEGGAWVQAWVYVNPEEFEGA